MKILLLNQTFHPDVMATGQYLTELALRLVERGHQVTVICSRRAYDHPERYFPKSETWSGVKIRRIATTAFGKQTKWRRVADFASFIFSCCLRLLVTQRPDVVVALTSPPLISFLGACFARLRGARFVYWVMDLNPDEAIAAGWLREGSAVARGLHALSRFSFRRAQKIIALDRFMRQQIEGKGVAPEKIAIIPPWSHDDIVRFDSAGRDAFRKAHGLDGMFVVMYSGNHSPVHPLDTLIHAAEKLREDPSIAFCFVGGGSEFRRLEAMVKTQNEHSTFNIQHPTSNSTEHGGQRSIVCGQSHDSNSPQPPPPIASLPSSNIVCLPYQPLDQLAGALSAADLHVVVMGDAMVGLVHPCKIYNILSVGAPILYIGPEPSHVTEILSRAGGQQLWGAAAHGEVEKVVAHIQRIRHADLNRTGNEFGQLAAEYGKGRGLSELVALLGI